MTEVKVLKKKYSAADIILFLPNGMCTAIMVDGVHHFRTTRDTRDHNAQNATDDAFNTSAAKHGIHVIRLHYKDSWQYERFLRTSLQMCSAAEEPLLVKSPSFQIADYVGVFLTHQVFLAPEALHACGARCVDHCNRSCHCIDYSIKL
jgi:hypothetical protein